jgi:hypothetical protein
MADQSVPSRFQALFESALQDYEQKTKINLAKHPLAEQLEKCHSVVDITALLQEQARALGGSDKIMKSIEHTVGALYKISDMADTMGLVRHRDKALMGEFHVSDTYSTALCETDTYWPRCHTRCTCLSQILTCILL